MSDLGKTLLAGLGASTPPAELAEAITKAPIEQVDAVAKIVITPPPVPRDLFEAQDPEFQEDPLRKAIRALSKDASEVLRKAVNDRLEVPYGGTVAQVRANLGETRGVFSKFLDLPKIDDAALKASVDRILAGAQGATPPRRLAPEHIAPIAKALVGMGAGASRITRVEVDDFGVGARIRAFDRAGYTGLFLHVSTSLHPRPSLHIDALQAARGRNADEMPLVEGEAQVPGRGRPHEVATIFRGLAEIGAELGFHALELRPGGESVGALYHRMGFVNEREGDAPYTFRYAEHMHLDLSNREKVEQLVLTFVANRAKGAVPDSEGVVKARIDAGEWLTRPEGQRSPPREAALVFELPDA